MGIDDNLTINSKKPLILIGLMGAGKYSVGKRLANALNLPFWDADNEIEATCNYSITEIFSRFGEPEFRILEANVINRLLLGPQHVLATGGGAFMNNKTRKLIKKKGISIWLRASLDVLLERTRKRKGRPLLEKGDPEKVFQLLINERHPIYGSADIIVDTNNRPHNEMVETIITEYKKFLG